jgi:hypothetical protein
MRLHNYSLLVAAFYYRIFVCLSLLNTFILSWTGGEGSQTLCVLWNFEDPFSFRDIHRPWSSERGEMIRFHSVHRPWSSERDATFVFRALFNTRYLFLRVALSLSLLRKLRADNLETDKDTIFNTYEHHLAWLLVFL